MIPAEHAEKLKLSVEASVEDAARRCHQLLQPLRQQLGRTAARHADRPALEASVADLEKILASLLVDGKKRLAATEESIAKLHPQNPVVLKHKRNRDRLAPVVAQMTQWVFEPIVFDLCCQAEAILEDSPPRKSKARQLLQQARDAGTELAPDSEPMRLLRKLEDRLRADPASPPSARSATSNAPRTASSPVPPPTSLEPVPATPAPVPAPPTMVMETSAAAPATATTADENTPAAQYHLGWAYLHGHNVAQDYAKALQCFGKAAARGDALAQYNLGWMHLHGLGVPQDHAAAAKWFDKSAQQGNPDAQNNLGWMHENGWGVPQDYAAALIWFGRAAEQGNASAQTNLGWMYQNGWGAERDYAAALQWFEKAAAQGDAAAQYNLGLIYQNGLGVPRDHIQALQWFRHAADQGDPDAQYHVGLMYENGWGTDRDLHLALEWYRKAAAQGDPQARAGLQRLQPSS